MGQVAPAKLVRATAPVSPTESLASSKRVCVAFAATSAACGAAPSAAALVGARALQAGAAAVLVPTSLALLLPEFLLARRATAAAVWGAVGALAAATGPTVGALLVRSVGWRWVFLVNLPVCAVAFVLGRRLLGETRDAGADRRPDPVGVVLVSATMGLLALAVVQGPEWGWADGRVLAAFAGAPVLLPAFLRHSARHPSPVVDPSLFRVRSYAVANVATLVFACGFFASILNNVLFLGGVWRYSVVRTGLAVSPGPILAAARQFGAVPGVATLVVVLGTPGPDEAMAAFDRAWTTVGLTALAAGAVSLLLGRPGRAPAGAPSSATAAATAAVPAVPARLATVER